MLGFNALSEAPFSSDVEVQASLPAVSVPVGAFGSSALGVYAIGRATDTTDAYDLQYVENGYWESGYADGDFGSVTEVDATATADATQITVSAPTASAGVAAVAVVSDVLQITVTSPDPASSGEAAKEVAVVAVTLNSAEASATAGAEATFADLLDIGISSPDATATAPASAQVSVPTIQISPPDSTVYLTTVEERDTVNVEIYNQVTGFSSFTVTLPNTNVSYYAAHWGHNRLITIGDIDPASTRSNNPGKVTNFWISIYDIDRNTGALTFVDDANYGFYLTVADGDIAIPRATIGTIGNVLESTDATLYVPHIFNAIDSASYPGMWPIAVKILIRNIEAADVNFSSTANYTSGNYRPYVGGPTPVSSPWGNNLQFYTFTTSAGQCHGALPWRGSWQGGAETDYMLWSLKEGSAYNLYLYERSGASLGSPIATGTTNVQAEFEKFLNGTYPNLHNGAPNQSLLTPYSAYDGYDLQSDVIELTPLTHTISHFAPLESIVNSPEAIVDLTLSAAVNVALPTVQFTAPTASTPGSSLALADLVTISVATADVEHTASALTDNTISQISVSAAEPEISVVAVANATTVSATAPNASIEVVTSVEAGTIDLVPADGNGSSDYIAEAPLGSVSVATVSAAFTATATASASAPTINIYTPTSRVDGIEVADALGSISVSAPVATYGVGVTALGQSDSVSIASPSGVGLLETTEVDGTTTIITITNPIGTSATISLPDNASYNRNRSWILTETDQILQYHWSDGNVNTGLLELHSYDSEGNTALLDSLNLIIGSLDAFDQANNCVIDFDDLATCRVRVSIQGSTGLVQPRVYEYLNIAVVGNAFANPYTGDTTNLTSALNLFEGEVNASSSFVYYYGAKSYQGILQDPYGYVSDTLDLETSSRKWKIIRFFGESEHKVGAIDYNSQTSGGALNRYILLRTSDSSLADSFYNSFVSDAPNTILYDANRQAEAESSFLDEINATQATIGSPSTGKEIQLEAPVISAQAPTVSFPATATASGASVSMSALSADIVGEANISADQATVEILATDATAEAGAEVSTTSNEVTFVEDRPAVFATGEEITNATATASLGTVSISQPIAAAYAAASAATADFEISSAPYGYTNTTPAQAAATGTVVEEIRLSDAYIKVREPICVAVGTNFSEGAEVTYTNRNRSVGTDLTTIPELGNADLFSYSQDLGIALTINGSGTIDFARYSIVNGQAVEYVNSQAQLTIPADDLITYYHSNVGVVVSYKVEYAEGTAQHVSGTGYFLYRWDGTYLQNTWPESVIRGYHPSQSPFYYIGATTDVNSGSLKYYWVTQDSLNIVPTQQPNNDNDWILWTTGDYGHSSISSVPGSFGNNIDDIRASYQNHWAANSSIYGTAYPHTTSPTQISEQVLEATTGTTTEVDTDVVVSISTLLLPILSPPLPYASVSQPAVAVTQTLAPITISIDATVSVIEDASVALAPPPNLGLTAPDATVSGDLTKTTVLEDTSVEGDVDFPGALATLWPGAEAHTIYPEKNFLIAWADTANQIAFKVWKYEIDLVGGSLEPTFTVRYDDVVTDADTPSGWNTDFNFADHQIAEYKTSTQFGLYIPVDGVVSGQARPAVVKLEINNLDNVSTGVDTSNVSQGASQGYWVAGSGSSQDNYYNLTEAERLNTFSAQLWWRFDFTSPSSTNPWVRYTPTSGFSSGSFSTQDAAHDYVGGFWSNYNWIAHHEITDVSVSYNVYSLALEAAPLPQVSVTIEGDVLAESFAYYSFDAVALSTPQVAATSTSIVSTSPASLLLVPPEGTPTTNASASAQVSTVAYASPVPGLSVSSQPEVYVGPIGLELSCQVTTPTPELTSISKNPQVAGPTITFISLQGEGYVLSVDVEVPIDVTVTVRGSDIDASVSAGVTKNVSAGGVVVTAPEITYTLTPSAAEVAFDTISISAPEATLSADCILTGVVNLDATIDVDSSGIEAVAYQRKEPDPERVIIVTPDVNLVAVSADETDVIIPPDNRTLIA